MGAGVQLTRVESVTLAEGAARAGGRQMWGSTQLWSYCLCPLPPHPQSSLLAFLATVV